MSTQIHDRDKVSQQSYLDKKREEMAQLNAYEQAMIAANKGRVSAPVATPTTAPSIEATGGAPNYEEYVRNNMKNAGAAAYEQGKAEAAGLNRVVIPKTENVSAQQVTTNPYQDFAKMWQKPITPEEEAKRERAARAVQGVAGLGNLMSAFANLTYTGKGAPSQTLPTQSVDAMSDKTTAWKDKLKAEREKYQAAELGAKVEQWKAELDAQHRAQAQANVDRAFEYQKSQDEKLAAERAQARQDKLAENEQKQSNWEKEHKAKEDYNKGMLGIYGRRADIQQQNADARSLNANTSRLRQAAKNGDKVVPLVYDSMGNNTVLTFHSGKLGWSTLEQISKRLPDSIKRDYNITKYSRTAEYKANVEKAIGAELDAGNQEVYDILNALGLVEVSQALNPQWGKDADSWNGYIDNSSTDWSEYETN